MRFLLTCLAAVLYAIGWVSGKAALMVAWAWSAVAVGFADAQRRSVKVA